MIGDGAGLRRQLRGGGGGGTCPQKIDDMPLDGWGNFWIVYILITLITIAVVSSPFPFGVMGLLDQIKAYNKWLAANPVGQSLRLFSGEDSR